MTLQHPIVIEGAIQEYAWGGYDFIAQLLRQSKADPKKPWAELWLGAHPKGPSRSTLGNLHQLIEKNGLEILGDEVAMIFEHRLPFLLKILDVRQMLSIQVHPTKAAAELGFAHEEQHGPSRTAPNRNYRDQNHKPELALALTDFYLLHGFKSEEKIAETLDEIPGWDALKPILHKEGVKGLYEFVMAATQVDINSWLEPLAERLSVENLTDKSSPHFWAKRGFIQHGTKDCYDRGIFSVYWFNLVALSPGEAIFQAAGIPHAYLEGVCVEIMANSDNVLRGGLTVKHIDVPELLKHVQTNVVIPQILKGTQEDMAALNSEAPVKSFPSNWKIYPTPAPDFLLGQIGLQENERLFESKGPAIYLVYKGEVLINNAGKSKVSPGQGIFVPAGVEFDAVANRETVIYRATANL
ncbi:MAG: mannose-6-phosphate isomerase, class I [Bacteroidota bacterium]